MPEYRVHEYAPLLDSSDMTPKLWMTIARDIARHYHDYDGFIVIHGTDTMAYTASALAFMLRGLHKPVVVTGSQIPLCELRNDGRENLITSLLVASEHPVPEVCLCFGNRLLRGCRATKVSANDFQAFDSPNFPPLGTIGIRISVNRQRFSAPRDAGTGFELRPMRNARVGSLRLFPGTSAELVRNVLRTPLEGLVLETYGSGNGPSDPEFLRVLAEAGDRGVVIANCTQCLHGGVDQTGYATGSSLARAGVVSGLDMTPEAALTKMSYLLSQNLGIEKVRRYMSVNLRGELTEPEAGGGYAAV
jgi:L-asparaginase